MAQTQIFSKKAQVHLIEESSQDTYSAPGGSGANMFLARNIGISYDTSNFRPEYVRGDGLSMDEIPGSVSGQITFEVLLKGSGSTDTGPEFGEALKACGMEEETSAGVSVTYSPVTTFDGASGNPGPSYSVSLLVDGTRHAIAGAFGTFVLTGEPGSPGILAFTFMGQYQAFADDGLEAPTYETTIAPPFRGASFATNFGGSYTPKGVTNFSLDLGNQVRMGPDVNESTGFYGARIVPGARNSRGSFDPEVVLQATNDYPGVQRAGTSGTITTGTIGSGTWNKWSCAVGRAVLDGISVSDSDGVQKYEVPFAVSSAATDVEDTNHDITLSFLA